MANNSDPKRYLKITGIPPSVKEQFMNISDNTGSSMSALIKPKIMELIDSYPEHMRKRKD